VTPYNFYAVSLLGSSARSARSVPLSERAQQVLATRLPWALKAHHLRYAWDKAKLALGLSDGEDFVVHALRRTCATRLVGLGINLRIIQQFMGHKSILTTLCYAHVSDDMLSAAASEIDRWNNVHVRRGVGDAESGACPPTTSPTFHTPSWGDSGVRTVMCSAGATRVAGQAFLSCSGLRGVL
jgi:hypothetical protein